MSEGAAASFSMLKVLGTADEEGEDDVLLLLLRLR